MSEILEQLTRVLAERRNGDPGTSYVASLHHKGLNRVLEKVGEEATETILAAKDLGASDPAGAGHAERVQALVGETADLWFHSLVMLHHLGLSAADVEAELARRFGTPGLEEKAARREARPR